MNKLAPRCLVAMVTLLPAYLLANPIPLPTPASMPLEEMRISIDNGGHVVFEGCFTFDAIPATVDAMRFPLPPVNASNLQLKQDGVPQPWALTTDTSPPCCRSLPHWPCSSGKAHSRLPEPCSRWTTNTTSFNAAATGSSSTRWAPARLSPPMTR